LDLRLANVSHKLPKTISHRRSSNLSCHLRICSQNHAALRLSDIPFVIKKYLLHN